MPTRPSILLCLLVLAAPLHAQQHQIEKATEALVVRHLPNPAEGSYSPQLARYKWPYRTEVKNNLEVPLRITHFEVYYYENGKWRPENVKKRALTGADFIEWYDDGDPVVEGWIKPGEVAVDAENWSGSGWYIPSRCKWTFAAKDRDGNEYHVEEEIALIPASPVQLNGKIVYQKFYRHHAGDDTAWAQPEFDDGDWTQIEYGAFPHDWWASTGFVLFWKWIPRFGTNHWVCSSSTSLAPWSFIWTASWFIASAGLLLPKRKKMLISCGIRRPFLCTHPQDIAGENHNMWWQCGIQASFGIRPCGQVNARALDGASVI
jgi:hypothetical protein